MIGYFTLIPIKKFGELVKTQPGIYQSGCCYVDFETNKLYIDGVEHLLYFAIDTGIKPEFETFVIKGKQTNVVYYTWKQKDIPTVEWFHNNKYARTSKADEYTRKIMMSNDRNLTGVCLMNRPLLQNFEEYYNRHNGPGNQHMKSNLFNIDKLTMEISLWLKQ